MSTEPLRHTAFQSSAAAGSGAASCIACRFWKHERQSTGRPCVGLKGTVVSAPHAEHFVRVSGLTLWPLRARFALHCLQCLGSFLNCLSWKKSCSPAVKTNSAPQSTHFMTRSVNSMANLPYRESHRHRSWLYQELAGLGSLFLSYGITRARTAYKRSAVFKNSPAHQTT